MNIKTRKVLIGIVPNNVFRMEGILDIRDADDFGESILSATPYKRRRIKNEFVTGFIKIKSSSLPGS